MKNRILWKIYLVWFFRRILPLMIFQVLVLVLMLKIFARTVFVGKVIENAAVVSNAKYWEFFKYLLAAFLETGVIVQIAILISFGIGALILRDIGRALLIYFNTLRQKNILPQGK